MNNRKPLFQRSVTPNVVCAVENRLSIKRHRNFIGGNAPFSVGSLHYERKRARCFLLTIGKKQRRLFSRHATQINSVNRYAGIIGVLPNSLSDGGIRTICRHSFLI